MISSPDNLGEEQEGSQDSFHTARTDDGHKQTDPMHADMIGAFSGASPTDITVDDDDAEILDVMNRKMIDKIPDAVTRRNAVLQGFIAFKNRIITLGVL